MFLNRELKYIYLSKNETVPEEIRNLYPEANSGYLLKFKEALIGLAENEEKNFTIKSEDAYGEGDLHFYVKMLSIIYHEAEDDYPTADFWGIEKNMVFRGNITINGTVHTNSDIKESSATLKISTETFFEANLNLTRDESYHGPKAVAYKFEIRLDTTQYQDRRYTFFVHFLDINGNGMIYHWDIVIDNTTSNTTTTTTTTSIPLLTSGFSMLIVAVLLSMMAFKRKEKSKL